MSTRLAFVDTETTGLDPDLHEIWEVGLILRHANGIEEEHLWHLPVHLGRADPMALKIGRFHERWMDDDPVDDKPQKVRHLSDFASEFADLTIGAHLVGAVISFDEERLRRLLRRQGQCPMWHYHLIDVEALAAGYMRGKWGDVPDNGSGHWTTLAGDTWCRPPWDSEELSAAIGVQASQFDRHTALGDARWARAIYDTVMGAGAAPEPATTEEEPNEV